MQEIINCKPNTLLEIFMSSKDNWTYTFCHRRKKSFIICISFQLCKLGNEFFCCVLIMDYIGILTTTSKGRILAQGTYGKKASYHVDC